MDPDLPYQSVNFDQELRELGLLPNKPNLSRRSSRSGSKSPLKGGNSTKDMSLISVKKTAEEIQKELDALDALQKSREEVAKRVAKYVSDKNKQAGLDKAAELEKRLKKEQVYIPLSTSYTTLIIVIDDTCNAFISKYI